MVIATGPHAAALPAASTTVPDALCGPSGASIANARSATWAHGWTAVYGAAQPVVSVVGAPPSSESVIAATPPPRSVPPTITASSPATEAVAAGAVVSLIVTRER